jgi:large subunit ribosomal protein L1
LFFKNDKNGQLNFTFGKKSLTEDQLEENLVAFCKALRSSKPATSKGAFLEKIVINSTMGPGIRVNVNQ